MKRRRPYRMGARAAAAEATGRRLVDAAIALFGERPYEEVTIDAVAARAEVTPQTLLRRFGSKAGLTAAAAAEGGSRVRAHRDEAPVGDPVAAVANLFDHYEAWGDVALRMVGQEERFPEIAEMARDGRALHAAWVDRVFAPQLAGLPEPDRAIRRAQFIATCDITMWKLLRRDLDLSRAEAEHAVRDLVARLCAPGRT